jgi:hypothetical protein
VIQEADFDYFKLGIIPSVQHATSDMYWAGQGRKERLKNAYKKLLKESRSYSLRY